MIGFEFKQTVNDLKAVVVDTVSETFTAVLVGHQYFTHGCPCQSILNAVCTQFHCTGSIVDIGNSDGEALTDVESARVGGSDSNGQGVVGFVIYTDAIFQFDLTADHLKVFSMGAR